MRLGRPDPLPSLAQPARALALVAAGGLVLATVQGWGALLIGFGLLAYGVCTLLTRPAAQAAAERPNTAAVAHRGRRERIVIERRTRERYWPEAS